MVPTIIAAESKQHSDGNDLARVRPNVSGRPSPAQPVDDDLELRYRELCEFVSIISHDLRNPLAAIRGYAQLLHRQARDDSFAALRPSLATIMEQADRLAGFTELLLDVARIRTSRVALQWVTVDLAPLAREASQTLTPPAKIDALPADGTAVVDGDVKRLRQIVKAMLEFAGERGSGGEGVPEITVGSGEGWATLEVRAPGVEIPANEADGLFEQLVHPSENGQRPSLGHVPLVIAAGLAEAHGGSLVAEPMPSGGTGLCLRLPLRREGTER